MLEPSSLDAAREFIAIPMQAGLDGLYAGSHMLQTAISSAVSLSPSLANITSMFSQPANAQSSSPMQPRIRRKVFSFTDICRIWKTTFGETFNAKCKLCRQSDISLESRSGEGAWEVSHIVPFASGGSDDISNLRPLCRKCNRQMGNQSFLTYIAENYPDRLGELKRDFSLQ